MQAAEERYRASLRRDYHHYPVHNAALDAQLRTLAQGEFAVIKRFRPHPFGTVARGPFVVQAQEGNTVRL